MLRALLTLTLLVASLAQPAFAQNSNSPLGTNLTNIADWSGDYPFVNAFKTSREWIPGNTTTWSDGSTLDLDSNGWIRSLKTGQVANNVIGAHSGRPGYYTVLYDGEGTIRYNGGAIKNTTLSSAGRDIVEYRPANGAFLFQVNATNPSNYLRNIRMFLPGGSCENDVTRWCDASTPCAGGAQCRIFSTTATPPTFNPDFLKNIAPYKLLRFMDWMKTNFSGIRSWSQRPLVSHATWATTRGVPLEVMIELANLMRADPWFCMPEAADDDYVRQSATLIRDRLGSGLKAYIEYTNEAWNLAFPSAKYTQDQGLALGVSTDRYIAGHRYYSQRAVEIFTIFRSVLGTARVVGVLSGQAASSTVGTYIMDWRNAYQSANAYAIAPYFGYSHGFSPKAEAALGLTIDQFMNVLETQDLPEAIGWMQANASETARRGLPLIAYEGGQHLAADYAHENIAALNAVFDAANLHPRMQTIYMKYLQAWRNAGGRYFAHFLSVGTWSKSGRWGALRDLYQAPSTAPKHLALQQFIQENPRWWPDGPTDVVAPGRPNNFRAQ